MKLTAYQRAELQRMRADGWEVLAIHRYATDDNPWATIEIRKGDYRTKAAVPSSRAIERYVLGAS